MGLYFSGAQFCPHCGGRAARAEEAGPHGTCPDCNVPLEGFTIGSSRARRCGTCEGLWMSQADFTRTCSREEQRAVALELLPVLKDRPRTRTALVAYRKCPACAALMTRRNPAAGSGIVVDVCARHGVWLDKDELPRIVAHIRDGGLASARAAEQARIEFERRAAERCDRGAQSDGTVDFLRVLAKIFG